MSVTRSHLATHFPELLSASQVAALLSISSRLVWLLAAQGKLRPVRIRRCTRWRRRDILRFIDRLASSSVKSEASHVK